DKRANVRPDRKSDVLLIATLQGHIGHKLYIQRSNIHTDHKGRHGLGKYPSIVSAVHVSSTVRVIVGTIFWEIHVFAAMMKPLAIIPIVVVAITVSVLLHVFPVLTIALFIILVVFAVTFFCMLPICFLLFMKGLIVFTVLLSVLLFVVTTMAFSPLLCVSF